MVIAPDAADPGTCLRRTDRQYLPQRSADDFGGNFTGNWAGLWSGLLVGISTFDTEVLSRSKPTLLDLGIAVAAGSVSGYAKTTSGSLVGTAIAVALMPPICVIGLGLAQANWSLSQGATLLY